MWAKRTYSNVNNRINGTEKELGRTRGTLEYILSGEESDIRALSEAESTTAHEDTREEEDEEEEEERERENTSTCTDGLKVVIT